MADHADVLIEQQLAGLRPRLHRYCARMVGSTVDGEDVVQDAMIKAYRALPTAGTMVSLEGWMFRIAHNTALDFVRRRARAPDTQDDDALDLVAAPDAPEPGDESIATSLRTFMRLAPLQRSTVILKDVLGHSIEEITSITDASAPAVKSALQRGRLRLRALSSESDDVELPQLSDAMRARLTAYVNGFVAGDFDAVRAMLADEVRLDLVSRLQRKGKSEVGDYLGRYAESTQWAFAPGIVDGRAAMLVYDREPSLVTPAYFVVLDVDADRIVSIRDFLFARYAMDGVELRVVS